MIYDLFIVFVALLGHLPLTSAFLSQIRLTSDWTQSFGSAFATPLLTKVGRVPSDVVVSFPYRDEGETAGAGAQKNEDSRCSIDPPSWCFLNTPTTRMGTPRNTLFEPRATIRGVALSVLVSLGFREGEDYNPYSHTRG